MTEWPNTDLDYHATVLRESVRLLKEYGWQEPLNDILEVADSLSALAHPIKVIENDSKGID